MKYKHIAIGGTFDLLHDGHKKFIKYAFSLGGDVTIGISSDKFVSGLKGGCYWSFDQRSEAVYDFLKSHKFLSNVNIVQLNDKFGPTIKDRTIDCLLVTKDSLSGATEINRQRTNLGLKNLSIEIFQLVLASDKKAISSNRIKSGKINQSGQNYYDYLISKGDLHLPKSLRQDLRRPFGRIYKNLTSIKSDNDRKNLVATVGDFTTQSFLSSDIFFNLAIIDLKVQRQNTFSRVEDLGFTGGEKIIKVVNPPGIISQLLIEAVYESLTVISKNKTIILVDGEEDLAVLPVVLLAPLGICIYYGIRGNGLVRLKVTPEIKEVFFKLLKKFDFNLKNDIL